MSRPFAALSLVVIGLSSTARVRAQGLDAELAPERQIRVPDIEAEEPEIDEREARAYRDGQLVPPGYEVVTTYHGPLLGSGAAIFAFHWVLGVVLARTDLALGDAEDARAESRNNPLMAPLIGPFVALAGEEGRPGGESALIALDGVAQIGGLAMAMLGLTLRQKWLVPIDLADLALGITTRGATLDVRF